MAAYGDAEHPNQAAVIEHWDNVPKAGYNGQNQKLERAQKQGKR